MVRDSYLKVILFKALRHSNLEFLHCETLHVRRMREEKLQGPECIALKTDLFRVVMWAGLQPPEVFLLVAKSPLKVLFNSNMSALQHDDPGVLWIL